MRSGQGFLPLRGLQNKTTPYGAALFLLLGDKDSNLDSQDQNLESYH